MKKLKKKVIIVTGGSGLIGLATLKHIAKEGAIVINADIKPHPRKINAKFHKMDITKKSSIQKTIKKVIKTYGRIDGLVNNAYPRTEDWGNRFELVTEESWKANVDMQMNSVFNICQLISEEMKKQKNGSIVNLASIYGVVGNDFTVYDGTDMTSPAAYAAIKGGIINFTRYLASYFGENQIRVNTVSPGGVFNHQPKRFVENYEHKVPLKRMAQPEDIAPAISFLLSDESSYITGHNLIVDGGWSAI